MSKRLNIMLYSNETGEQIILPINPEEIEIKYEKTVKEIDILGFGKVNIMGNQKPVNIKFSHFLPEDDSIFNTNARISYETEDGARFIEYDYTSKRAVNILRKWAFNKNKIRLVIDDELNMECIVVSFEEKIRESTLSKPCVLEIIEFRNPSSKSFGLFGLIKRIDTINVPKTILMKEGDTVYSIADKYGLDFKKLAEINEIKDVNASFKGKKLVTTGA